MYSFADHEIARFGFAGIEHLILNHGEGQIDTGRMMKSLLALVRSMDVEVLSGLGVSAYEENADGIVVKTTEGFSVKSRQMVITTNAFARELLPDMEVQPGRAQVLITEAIPGLKVKGTFHYDKGYYYFRNVGNRLLLGGGRNLDFETEETIEFGLTKLVQDRLEMMLREVILPGFAYKIEQRWSGIMGLGNTRSTIVKRLSPSLCCAVRMGGMGIAIGTLVGEEAAELLTH
jgi:glycine/D-amino acid oxidase-like deaminating enzyme